jgi:hypothetical protein
VKLRKIQVNQHFYLFQSYFAMRWQALAASGLVFGCKRLSNGLIDLTIHQHWEVTMKITLLTLSVLSLSLMPLSASQAEEITPEQQPCFDLIVGWYAGDARKMGNFMHESFIKKGVLRNAQGKTVTTSHDKQQFIDAVASVRELTPPEGWDITAKTVHLRGDIATVEVQSRDLVDVCQLGNIDGEWQIMNVIWIFREK